VVRTTKTPLCLAIPAVPTETGVDATIGAPNDSPPAHLINPIDGNAGRVVGVASGVLARRVTSIGKERVDARFIKPCGTGETDDPT